MILLYVIHCSQITYRLPWRVGEPSLIDFHIHSSRRAEVGRSKVLVYYLPRIYPRLAWEMKGEDRLVRVNKVPKTMHTLI